ncbi:hypothetical protein ADK58_22235 [Streptomyces sp. XY152]|nr:hypothetical protein ADK58_22235 [Streptomyces sp. XY152]
MPRATALEGEAARPVAWLIPAGGGIERTTPVGAIEPVTVLTPGRQPSKRADGRASRKGER